MILLAVITGAHGIKGAVKVKTFTQSPENILSYGLLQDEHGQDYKLKIVRVTSSGQLIATIKGIENRNQADTLRGTKLYVAREQLPTLPKEEFYYNDLIGLPVKDLQDHDIGHVISVGNYGAGDFLEISDQHNHIYTISFTREAVPLIELSDLGHEGIIKIDRRYLLDSLSQDEDDRNPE